MFAGRWYHLRSENNPEAFYPAVHVSRAELLEEKYLSVPDYQILGVQETESASFEPVNLFHVTNDTRAKYIISHRAFGSTTPKRIGQQSYVYFSWWSLEIDQAQKEREENKYEKIINQKPEIADALFFSSPAFLPESRYGNFKFTYNIQTLIEAYQNSVCNGEKAELRVLGTYRFKVEIMHTVAVVPPGEDLFQDYPLVPDDPAAIISVSDQGWKWKPISTSTKTENSFRQWDHVAFAFYLPLNEGEFKMPAEPTVPLTFCKIGKPNLSRAYPVAEEDFNDIKDDLCRTYNDHQLEQQ